MRITLLSILVVFLASGCWAKDPACTVIKTAADVCTYVEYVGEDGKVHRVKVSRAEVEELARISAAREGAPKPVAE